MLVTMNTIITSRLHVSDNEHNNHKQIGAVDPTEFNYCSKGEAKIARCLLPDSLLYLNLIADSTHVHSPAPALMTR